MVSVLVLEAFQSKFAPYQVTHECRSVPIVKEGLKHFYKYNLIDPKNLYLFYQPSYFYKHWATFEQYLIFTHVFKWMGK